MRSRNVNGGWLLRFEQGEELIGALGRFAAANDIRAGAFTAIGAASEVELGFYDLPNKTYRWKTFSGMFELASGIGNMSRLASSADNEPIVHMHGVFTDAEYRAFGGHVRRLVVGATVELALNVFADPIERTFDEATGLNLLDL